MSATTYESAAAMSAEPTHAHARFWDRIAKRYARRPVSDEAAYRHKLQLTQSYLRPHMDVFEFGCGTGSTALEHAPLVRRILATDVSGEMVSIARGKADAADVENVAFETAAFDQMDLFSESFDVVLGMSVLHLVPDWNAAIAKVNRALRPGGLFVSSTPCLSEVASWLRWVHPIARALGLFPPVLRFFRKQELLESLQAHGFAIEECWQPGPRAAVFVIARKL